MFEDGTEQRRAREGRGVHHGGEAFAVGARQVFRQAAAGDVRKAMHAVRGECGKYGFDVDFGRGQQVLADALAVHDGVKVGKDFAQERVAVAVVAGRRQADEDVARRDFAAVDEVGFFDDADGKAGDVVFARLVEAGHFCGFAADERRARLRAAVGDAFDDVGGDFGFEFAAGEVVEEVLRRGAVAEDVVDAHGDGINADGVVFAEGKGDFQLGADAVGAGDEDGVLVAAQVVKGAKGANLSENAGIVGRARVALDALNGIIARFFVHARAFVVEAHASFSSRSSRRSRMS